MSASKCRGDNRKQQKQPSYSRILPLQPPDDHHEQPSLQNPPPPLTHLRGSSAKPCHIQAIYQWNKVSMVHKRPEISTEIRNKYHTIAKTVQDEMSASIQVYDELDRAIKEATFEHILLFALKKVGYQLAFSKGIKGVLIPYKIHAKPDLIFSNPIYSFHLELKTSLSFNSS